MEWFKCKTVFENIHMQSPTHFLTGMILFRVMQLLFPALPSWIFIPLVIIIGVLSHFLLDSLARMTYHLPDPQWKDPFWVSYHVIFVYLGTLVMLIVFWTPYWWVMLASLLPDIIDWYLLRPLFKIGPVVHPYIDKLRNSMFTWVPDWTAKKWTVILELTYDGILLTLLLLIFS